MLNLLLMVGVLLVACIIAVILMNRLMHSAQRLNTLHDELARNDELLNEQVQRLAAAQDAQSEAAPDETSPDETSENLKEK